MYNPFNQNFGYPQMPQFNNFRQPVYSQPQFIVKQVTSVEEARASIIDPLSSYLFIDSSTGNIYLKRMNNNGLSDFYTYVVSETTDAVKSDPLEAINVRLGNIEKLIGDSYDKSISGTAGYAESKPIIIKSDAKSESTTVQQGAADDKWQNRDRTKGNGK